MVCRVHRHSDYQSFDKLTKFTELSIQPSLNKKLVPEHARAALLAKGLDIDNFTPMTKDEMMAKLD
jgi:hypothetical protein